MDYFRVSEREPSRRYIEWLFDHLESVGVPCAIMKHKVVGRDKIKYSVWRAGEEAVSESASKDRRLEDIFGDSGFTSPEIVKECHDFGRRTKLI